MAYKPRFNSKRRENAWYAAKAAARQAGLGNLPICNLCNLAVRETDDWDESHDPSKPKCFGGRATGVAHRSCNREHGAQVVVPAKAKADRVRRKHIGAARQGMGPRALPGGRRAGFKIAIGGGRKPRLTNAERHRRFMASRALRDADGKPIGAWAPDPPRVEG